MPLARRVPAAWEKDKSVIEHNVNNNTRTTHLNTRLPKQRTLQVRQTSTDFVTHGRLAVLGPNCCLATARGRSTMVSTSAAGAGGLGAC